MPVLGVAPGLSELPPSEQPTPLEWWLIPVSLALNHRSGLGEELKALQPHPCPVTDNAVALSGGTNP